MEYIWTFDEPFLDCRKCLTIFRGSLPDPQIQNTTESTNPEHYRIHKSGTLPDLQIQNSTEFCDSECEKRFMETRIHDKKIWNTWNFAYLYEQHSKSQEMWDLEGEWPLKVLRHRYQQSKEEDAACTHKRHPFPVFRVLLG